jgi:putative acetyltransferase
MNPSPPPPPPITVRRAQPGDAAVTAQLMADPAVQRNTMQLPHANEGVWAQRLADMLSPGKTDVLLVAERPDAAGALQLVGLAGLHPAGPALRRRHVMSLGISIAAAAQGQGVGTVLMAALLDYADHWAQVLRTELTVFADNQRAIGLYQRFGFEREGLHRAYALRDGHYADVVAMARLHPKPPGWGPAPLG